MSHIVKEVLISVPCLLLIWWGFRCASNRRPVPSRYQGYDVWGEC